MDRLQIIGVGSLGEAMASGLMRSGGVRPEQLILVHRDPTRAERIAAEYSGVTLTSDIQSGVDAIVSVRPEQVLPLLPEIEKAGVARIVSVAAGISLRALRSPLDHSMVLRAMPNIAVKYGLGQTAIALSPSTDVHSAEWAEWLFGLLGDALVIDEAMFDAFTAISGCAPGFLMRFVLAMADAAVVLGFEYEDAQRLLTSSLRGNACWLSENVEAVHEELELMTQLNGPTSALIASLDNSDFDASLRVAAEAAAKRSHEMCSAMESDV